LKQSCPGLRMDIGLFYVRRSSMVLHTYDTTRIRIGLNWNSYTSVLVYSHVLQRAIANVKPLLFTSKTHKALTMNQQRSTTQPVHRQGHIIK